MVHTARRGDSTWANHRFADRFVHLTYPGRDDRGDVVARAGSTAQGGRGGATQILPHTNKSLAHYQETLAHSLSLSRSLALSLSYRLSLLDWRRLDHTAMVRASTTPA